MVDSLELWEEQVRKETAEQVRRETEERVRRETAEQVRRESTADAFTTVAERMIQRGMDGDGIAAVTGYDRNRIDSIAHRMNRTVNWAKAQA